MGKKISRPAQGQNSITTKPPRPAYKPDNGTPTVTNVGKLSAPKPNRWSGGKLKLLTQDATPKVSKR